MTINTISIDNAQSPVLTFSNDISYSLEGGQANLGASIRSDISKVNAEQYCCLQLWACNNPYFGGFLEGNLVAEVPVNPHYDESFLQQSAQASLPAGQNDYAMVMALVSQNDNGTVQIHDYTNFSNRQQFLQPQLQGKVSAVLRDTQVQVHVDRISNPRNEDILSGNLNLELWATREPYRGGQFEGYWMAGIELGQLPGNNDWVHNEFTLDLNPAPEGGWSLVLMLREWNGEAYETRDYFLLPPLLKPASKSTVVPLTDKLPESQQAEQKLAEQKPAEQKPAEQKLAEQKLAEQKLAEQKLAEQKLAEQKLAEQKLAEQKLAEQKLAEQKLAEQKLAEQKLAEQKLAEQKLAEQKLAEQKLAEQKLAEQKLAEQKQAESEKALDKKPEKVTPELKQADSEAEKSALEAKKKQTIRVAIEPDQLEVVSINTASAKELSKVKGLSLHVAKLIVANRPYTSLDDLINVKGVGEKSLDRLRDQLGL